MEDNHFFKTKLNINRAAFRVQRCVLKLRFLFGKGGYLLYTISEMKKEKIFFYVKILSAFGVLLAVYLLWQQIAQPAFRPCSINATINCDAVISGPVAKTLGISTPLYGLVGYIVIFIASVLRKTKLMLGMATFGLAFCLWIAYQELVLLRVICPVCILCQVTMLSIFTLSLKVKKIK